MKFKKGVMDDHSDNFAIVFAAMGVSRCHKIHFKLNRYKIHKTVFKLSAVTLS